MGNYRKLKVIMIFLFFVVQIFTLIVLNKAVNSELIHDLLSTTGFYLVYEIIESKFKLHTSNYIRGTVIISIISHNLLGNYLGLYITSTFFDRVQHIFSTYAFAILSYSIINKGFIKPGISKIREFVFIVALGISLGGVLEIIEFCADVTLKPQIPYQPSLADTDLDLISDVFGALIAALHLICVIIMQRFNLLIQVTK